MEAVSPISYGRTLLEASIVYASVLYGVLEFLKAGGSHIGRTASDRGSCGLGLGGLPVPGKKVSVYHLYRADADAFSGDHAFSISGVKPGGGYEYSLGGDSSGGFFHISGISYLPGVLRDSKGAAGGGKDRRGRGMVSVLADRASFVFGRDSFGNGAGFSGILESD